MTVQAAIQNKISEKLAEARLKNPAFSIRAFSKRIGMSPATLSRVLNGRRSVSRKSAEQILDRMGLSPADSCKILALFPDKRPYRRTNNDSADLQQSFVLTMDQYHVVSQWYHFGLRALLRTKDAQSRANSNPKWLAERLGIRTAEAQQAIERLLRLEMIERLPNGRLRATDVDFHSPDGVPSASIRHNHAQHLDLARASLERDSVDARDFTNLVLAINPNTLPKAKTLIRHFRKELASVLEGNDSESREEVYNIAVQLFPLTRIHK